MEAAGFQDEPVITGLEEPTNFRFAPDGRVFVAEKTGKILVFDGIIRNLRIKRRHVFRIRFEEVYRDIYTRAPTRSVAGP